MDRQSDFWHSGALVNAELATRMADILAYILDLDGVITDTASVHAKAWKQTFDGFLESRARSSGEDFRPFDEFDDYRRYVDGRPRYDGVRSFLESRGIDLVEGSPSDDPSRDTVHGLGNRKNEIFQDLLTRDDVEVYEDAVRAVKSWKHRGRKVAVVSSSRNCGDVLEAAGLKDTFEIRVDGNTLQELGLPGKPAPDAFLEAARRLGVAPERAAIFEDAVSGVEAGRSGNFAVVVGVDRSGDAEKALRDHGADIVVRSFAELDSPILLSKDQCLEVLRRRLERRRGLALFLDYDGTLTPIVSNPDDAVLSNSMRRVLESLAARLPVAVVSGRDRADVERRVGIPEIYYAGSHGFDISGPAGFREEHEGGESCIPSLDEAEAELSERLDGPRLERKRFALAIHYRNLPDKDVPDIERAVQEVVSRFPDLRMTGGKKIFELRPALDWNKGKAVLWILGALGLSLDETLPVYIGDDVTDEDAFRALAEDGFGLCVGECSKDTAARGSLEDVSEVESFLSELSTLPELVQ